MRDDKRKMTTINEGRGQYTRNKG